MPRTFQMLLSSLVIATLAVPAAAQGSGGASLTQVERKYSRMDPVHIKKCDKNGDGLYDRAELLCVNSIYQVMYLDR